VALMPLNKLTMLGARAAATGPTHRPSWPQFSQFMATIAQMAGFKLDQFCLSCLLQSLQDDSTYLKYTNYRICIKKCIQCTSFFQYAPVV
jgi:hypothetical protein